jgi:alginate O-acetyltransferase complex protein AlgI
MIFSSIQYLIFLPLVVVLYWRTSGATRLWLVVLASYFFYMSWLPIYGTLLLLMTTLNWALGLWMESSRNHSKARMKGLLALGLAGNLGCLSYYKYDDFFFSNGIGALNWVAKFLQVPAPFSEWSPMGILLPLGISFFVFEFVHYIVDIYRGDKPVKSWLEFAAFAAFFPSQIAGPIKRYQDFIDWLRKPLPWSEDLLAQGGSLIAQGMFKKVAIADPIGGIIFSSFATQAPLSCPDAWIASIGFVIQVYCDFSGYTDIGRGSALLLGIKLPENFTLPYLSHDLADFWRRWHMSLGSWLRDYVYIPLGGSRRAKLSTWNALFMTMVVCGLWHGAAWHYVIFGAIQGLGLVLNREWKLFLKKRPHVATVCDTAPVLWFGTFLTMLFITMTYTIFRAPNMAIGWNVIGCWFSSSMDCTLWLAVVKSGVLYLLTLYAGFWLTTEAVKKFQPTLSWGGVYPAAIRYASWTAAMFLIVAARPTIATPFVYFQF